MAAGFPDALDTGRQSDLVALITQSCPTEPLVTVMLASLFRSRRQMSVATPWPQDGG